MKIRYLQITKTLSTALLFLLLMAVVPAFGQNPNLVNKGDFEDYNLYGAISSPSYTSYQRVNGVYVVEKGRYVIDNITNYHGVGQGWPVPSNSHGKYMIVNGFGGIDNQTKVVWGQTVPVSPQVIYTMSYRVVNLNRTVYGQVYPAKIQVKVNNSNLGSAYQLPTNNNWQERSHTWTNGNSTEATLEFYDICTDNSDWGDDFCIDDIVFKMHDDYSLSTQDFSVSFCSDDITPIDLTGHYTLTWPSGGNSAPPMQVKIKYHSGDVWASPGTTITTGHGTAYVGTDNKIYYTPNQGYLGHDYVRYQITRFGLESPSRNININIMDAPNIGTIQSPIPIIEGDSYNLTPPTIQTNGSAIISQGWQIAPHMNGTYTQFNNYNVPYSNNDYWIRYFAENECGISYSNSVQITVYQNDNIIVFTDSNVKAICVANWDTDGDGELSYDEAAAVTDLGQVFRNNATITSFEELQYFTGLTSIGNQTFYFCTGLTSIQIPSSVTSIGTSAFYDCLVLTSIEIPNSVTTIGDWAFQCCSGLLSIEIPNSVTTLGIGAFNSCIGLTAIEIPNSIINISLSTFSGCRNLISVVIPNSIISIGASAFQNCNSLSMIEIPNSVESIGNMAFYNCDGLEQIVVNQENIFFDSRENCNAIIETSTNKLIVGCKNTTIHNSVTSIGDYAFYGCSGLVSLEIPESITSIGYHAFADCTGLISIEIPNSVTSIGGRAFWSCSNLSNVSIGNSVSSIVEGMFYLCTSLTSVEIPNSVTSIGSCAFYGCNGLASVGFGNSVASIQGQAFAYCTNLTSITIPNSVISIGSGAFWACNELEQIIVDSGNPVYDSRESCNAIIKTSSNQLIAGCKNSIVPNTVTSIGEDAFRFCESLTSIVIPNSVTLIANNAFSYCSNMMEIIVLRTTPPSLGNNVFSYPNNCLIYVPYEYTNAYRTANRWSNYASRIFPMSYTTIPAYSENTDNWHFIASPLVENTNPTAVNNLITETAYDLYRFDQSEDLEWRNYEYSENTQDFMLENGQGYLYANEEDVNLIFKGNFNEDETKEIVLTYDANADLSGWNLVGNPFPVSAYANMSYYVMNEAGTAIEPVAVSMETAIPACTGVMVKADYAGESVTFSKTVPEMVPNQGNIQIAVMKTNKSGVSMIDKAIVSFNAGDRLEKFVFNEDNAQLYIPDGKINYAIVCAEKTGEMPLNFKANKNGVYSIIVDSEMAEMEYLHLIDNLTGNNIDLLVEPSYTFEAKTTDYASRFRLVFSICEDANGDNETFAYFNGSEWVVANEGRATLQVVDMLGHVLSSETVNGNATLNLNEAPGVYTIRLIQGDNVMVQKIIVR